VLPLTSGIGLVAIALAREHDSLGITEHRWEADERIHRVVENVPEVRGA